MAISSPNQAWPRKSRLHSNFALDGSEADKDALGPLGAGRVGSRVSATDYTTNLGPGTGFNSPTQCEPPHPSLARSGPVRRGRPGHLRRRAPSGPLSTELSYAADCLKAEIYRRLLGSSGRLAWSLAPAGHFLDASHGLISALSQPILRQSAILYHCMGGEAHSPCTLLVCVSASRQPANRAALSPHPPNHPLLFDQT
jgi:hypothetical protein